MVAAAICVIAIATQALQIAIPSRDVRQIDAAASRPTSWPKHFEYTGVKAPLGR
jgi:hypothetical protein